MSSEITDDMHTGVLTMQPVQHRHTDTHTHTQAEFLFNH